MLQKLRGVYIFSDESGKYKSNNFYIRIALILNVDDYGNLTRNFIELKEKYGIPQNKEFKFSYLWVIKRYKAGALKIKDKDQNYFKNRDVVDLENFVSESIKLLANYNPKIIVVYTYFYLNTFKSRQAVEKDFLQTLMLRIEDSCKNCNQFAAIYYDDCNYNENLILKENYRKIFLESKYIKDYAHIKDSISHEDSAFSTGLQLTDFVSGIIHSFLKACLPENPADYSYSKKLFDLFISDWIRVVRGNRGAWSIDKTGFIPLYLRNKWDVYNLTQIVESKIKKSNL